MSLRRGWVEGVQDERVSAELGLEELIEWAGERGVHGLGEDGL